MLKILTLNLNYYGDKHGDWNRRKTLIAEAVRESEADIVAFQAACSNPEINEGRNQLGQLAELLPAYAYRHFFTANRQPDGRQEGNGLLAKIPAVETEPFLLGLTPGEEDPAQRLVVKSVFTRDSGDFTLFIGHFSWVAEQTKTNVEEALHFMNRSRNFLLVGDLNAGPESRLLQPFKQADLVDVWDKLRGNERGYTFESNEPFTRIDYAWADVWAADAASSIAVVAKERDGVRMSDHMGLLVSLDV